jgi:hypothetical protein
LPVREERSLPGLVEQRRATLAKAGAANLGGLLFGYIFLAAQEKVTSCRAAPGHTKDEGGRRKALKDTFHLMKDEGGSRKA